MRTKLIYFLKTFSQLDIFAHLSIIVGMVALAVFTASFFTFFLYLYQPVFSSFENVFLINPSVDYELLGKALKESAQKRQDIQAKLSQHYSDPFQ